MFHRHIQVVPLAKVDVCDLTLPGDGGHPPVLEFFEFLVIAQRTGWPEHNVERSVCNLDAITRLVALAVLVPSIRIDEDTDDDGQGQEALDLSHLHRLRLGPVLVDVFGFLVVVDVYLLLVFFVFVGTVGIVYV